MGQFSALLDTGGDPIPHGLNDLNFVTEPGIAPTLHVIGLANATYSIGSQSLNIVASGISDQVSFAQPVGDAQFDLFSGGGTDLLKVNSGSFTFDSDLGASGTAVNLNVSSGATVDFASTQHLNNLFIASGGSVQMADAGGMALDVNTLVLSGTLNLADNDLIVNTPTASPAASTAMTTLQEDVYAGVNATSTQHIVYSSTAVTDGMTLGVAPAVDVQPEGGPTTLDGQTIPSTALIVRYTLPGDANLDGIVNGDDAGIVAGNFNADTGTTPPLWYNGDFNGDGFVNGADMGFVSANFGSVIDTAFAANATVGVPFTLDLPTSTSAGTPVRWDINWGDGDFDSYAAVDSDGNPVNPSHTYTQTSNGPALIQATAVTNTGDPTVNAGLGQYHLTAIALSINATTSLVPLALTAAAADAFYIESDGSGNTIVTQNGTVVDTIATDTLLSLDISGDTAGTVTVDYSNGDPLPASGLITDSQAVDITGGNGADTLVTTATTAIFSNTAITSSEIRHPATSSISFLNAGTGDSVIALTGTVFVDGDPNAADGPAVLVDTNAEVILSGSQHLAALDVLPGGTARMAEDGASALVTDALSLSPATDGLDGGLLDLNDNDLIVHAMNSSSANLTAVTGWLAAGSAADWTDLQNYGGGPAPAAIISAVAGSEEQQGNTALGLDIVGSPGTLVPGLFDGEPISTGDLVVRFGWWGDANVDGQVDSNDYGIFASNYGDAGNWFQGDFNYDGVIDANDYGILADEYGGAVPFQLLPAAENQPYSFTLPGGNVVNGGLLASITSWQVRWGDGSYTNYPVVSGANPDVTATHTYATPNTGGYQLAIVATGIDDNGNDTSYILPHQDLVITPDEPTDLAATETNAGEVDLTWADDTAIATNYVLTATPTSSGGATIKQTLAPDVFTASVTGLTLGATYSFSVVATNVLADDITASSAPATTAETAPLTNLSVTGPTAINEGSTGNTLNLSSGTSSNIVSWTVQWTDDSGNVLSTDTLSGSSGNDAFPTTAVAGLIANVTAVDSAGNVYDLPTYFAGVTPTPPSNVVATVISSSEVDLMWMNNSNIAQQFNILRSDNGGPFSMIDTVDGSTTSYNDTSVAASDDAQYEIEAVGSGGDTVSAPSAPQSVTTATGAPVITSLVTDAATDTATLTWTYQGNDANGFEVEMEDESLPENFHDLSNFTSTAPDSVTVDIVAGDIYKFRMRADHVDGTVSAYVDAGPVSIQLAPAPELNVADLTEIVGGFSYQRIRVGWSGVLPSASVEIQVTGPAWPGDEWHTVWYGQQGSGNWPSGYQDDDANLPADTTDEGYALDPGVDDYGSYSFRIRSQDAYGNPTQWSSPGSGSDGDPQSGVGLDLSSTDTTITATWGIAAGLNGLSMQLASAPLTIGLGPEFDIPTPQLTADGSQYTTTIGGLTPGTAYEFDLWDHIALLQDNDAIPEFAFTKGAITTTGVAQVTMPAPAAPSKIMDNVQTGKLVANNIVHLAWTNTPNNEDGFTVERLCLTGDYPNLWTTIATVGADVTTYDDIGVRPGNYKYRITAFNAGGSAATTTYVEVWPPGHLEALDGTTDTPSDNTLITRFFNDYHQLGNYVTGVPWIVQILGIQLAQQIGAAYSDVQTFYQTPSNRQNNIPLDIVGYSRGGFGALVLMYVLDNVGIPIQSTARTISLPIYGPFGLVLGHHNVVQYAYYKPRIRFMGLISPVGQSSLISELVALITLGLVQFNPGWNTEIPSCADIFVADYSDPLENPVLPQVPTGGTVFVPSGDNHVTISQDQAVEVAMWEAANSDNVPVPERPSDFDPGGI